MPKGKQSRGICAYCGYETTKGSMGRHLATCSKRGKLLRQAEHKGIKEETLYHLRVQDAWRSEFWLDLEMRGSATLKNLGDYLRAIFI